MKIEEKFQNLKSKLQQLDSLRIEVQKDCDQVFDDYCKYLFDKFPRLKSFGWNQYTPYFNDGSPCVFSANTDYIKINGVYADESNWISPKKIIHYGKWNYSKKIYEGRVEEENPDYDSELSEITDFVRDFVSQFDNDFFLNKFGDHCEVKVTKNGIDIDELDHD